MEVEEADLERDRDASVRLFRTVYPTSRFGEALFSWRYESAPGGPAPMLVVRDGEALVAQLVLMPRDLTVEGVRRRGWLIVDVMTHPDWRGRGILRALATRAAELATASGIITCGYPNELSVRGFRECGFDALCRVPALVGSALDGDASFGPFAPVADVGDWMADLWRRVGRVGTHRDADTVRWRLARPDATYHAFSTAERDAFVVLKRYEERDGEVVINICDVLVTGDERAEEALALARAFAEREGGSRLTAWLAPSEPARAVFEQGGMRPDATDRVVIIRANEPAPGGGHGALYDPARWHAAQLDSDVF